MASNTIKGCTSEFCEFFTKTNMILLGIIVFIISFFVIFSNKKEKFISFSDFDQYVITPKTTITDLTSVLENTSYTGTIHKTYDNNTKMYTYIYKLNLPNSLGGDYISTSSPQEYIVLAGTSKDMNSLKTIGQLTRSSDGWYYFVYVSDINLTFTRIILNRSDYSLKPLILFENQI